MASIKNIQLKAVKTFGSRNGIGFEANVYMDNKRIGSVSDKGMGGTINVTIYPEFRNEFNSRIDNYFDTDAFFNELFMLHLREDDFKKVVKKYEKKGMPNAWLMVVDYDKIVSKDFAVFNNDHIKKVIEHTNGGNYIIYKSKNDFIIN